MHSPTIRVIQNRRSDERRCNAGATSPTLPRRCTDVPAGTRTWILQYWLWAQICVFYSRVSPITRGPCPLRYGPRRPPSRTGRHRCQCLMTSTMTLLNRWWRQPTLATLPGFYLSLYRRRSCRNRRCRYRAALYSVDGAHGPQTREGHCCISQSLWSCNKDIDIWTR